MKKTASVISTVILVILIIAALFVAVPRLFGIKMYSVLSGSMEDTLSVGDLIYVFPTDPEKIKEGDVISFVLNKNLLVATHRVVAIDRDTGHFTTKGDANNANDAESVLYGNVIGVEKFSIPRLGYFFDYVNTTAGRIIAITIIAALTIFTVALSDGKKKPAMPDDEGPVPPDKNESDS